MPQESVSTGSHRLHRIPQILQVFYQFSDNVREVSLLALTLMRPSYLATSRSELHLRLKSSPSVGGFLGGHPRLLPKKSRARGRALNHSHRRREAG
jgi:hypothetical protein